MGAEHAIVVRMPLADFVHLRVHSAYSLSEGAITIKDLVNSKISELGENLIIRRFTRYMVGEDLGE